jgi:protein SCO1/2
VKLSKLYRAVVYIFLAAVLAMAASADAEETTGARHVAKPQSAARERLIAAEDMVGKKVGDFTLIDQDGASFEIKQMLGKPYLINFIYTSCNHACPLITQSLADAVMKVKKQLGVKFRVLTVGIDVENDSPDKLREFGLRFVDDFDGWRFATADRKTIEALTSNFGFFYQKEQLGGFTHMNMITLVGSDGVIKKHIYGMQPRKKEILKPLKKVW